jgi:protein phosphatase PTC7
MPHPEKLEKGGEDSYYACPVSQSFGVADGVGGWASQGVDPGVYSRRVLQESYDVIRRESTDRGQGGADLRTALLRAVDEVTSRQLVGGTTVLLGQLSASDSTLTVLNFGDSGLMILRPSMRRMYDRQMSLEPRVVFRTQDQTHCFNCPYQVSSSSTVMEPPDQVSVAVEAGDLIIAASDGLFDNVFDHEIQWLAKQSLVRAWVESGVEMQPELDKFAIDLAQAAQTNGMRQHGPPVPFGISAEREGLRHSGGKLDDTTVVVAMVMPQPPGAPSPASAGPYPKLHNFQPS